VRAFEGENQVGEALPDESDDMKPNTQHGRSSKETEKRR
jgi:hypothetical protein